MDEVMVSVVLPAHNEESALEKLLPELRTAVEGLGVPCEVLVVNDGSTDNTAAVVSRQATAWPRLRLLEHAINRGQTEALATGVSASRGSIVVIMDADGQSDPADIEMMVARLRARPELMMVAGRRMARRDSLLRKIPSWIANRLIASLSGTTITDTGCGLKAIRGPLIRSVHFGPDMHRFLPVILAMEGATYEVVDVRHRPRRFGRPHYGLERTGRVLLDILALRFTSRRSRPYHALGYVGLACMAVAMLLNLYILFEKYSLGIWVHRNPLFLVAILLFLTGLQIFVLGLVCEIMAVMLNRQGPRDGGGRHA